MQGKGFSTVCKGNRAKTRGVDEHEEVQAGGNQPETDIFIWDLEAESGPEEATCHERERAKKKPATAKPVDSPYCWNGTEEIACTGAKRNQQCTVP
jgi:hypothetical protein